MRFSISIPSALAFFSAATAVTAIPHLKHESRDTTTTRPSFCAAKPLVNSAGSLSELEARDVLGLQARQQQQINIGVYIHVLACGSDAGLGFVPRSQVDAQFAHMQSSFAPYGISFTLKAANIVNAGYPFCETPPQDNEGVLDMKRAYRQGTYADLNIYYNTFSIRAGHYGNATFPVQNPTADDVVYDGIVVNYQTMTGGIKPDRGEGDVTVHEIGHWLNLYHVYQHDQGTDPCDPITLTQGDFISDTPPLDPNQYLNCDVPNADSCPNLPGLDPVNNYMHFLEDRCLSEFTPQQVARMKASWNQHRARFVQ